MKPSFQQYYGPWALVTGASSGIGAQFAELLAAKGLQLVVTARRQDRLAALQQRLNAQYNTQVVALELDLAAADCLEVLQQATADKEVGLVVANAGLGFKGLHHTLAPAGLRQMLDVNVRAPTLLANAFAAPMVSRKRGGLIFTGSMEGLFSVPFSAGYAASKAYVHSLGEALWHELKPAGVDVLVLAPGATDTENLQRQGFDPQRMKGLMTPKEVAALALEHIADGPIYVPGPQNRLTAHLIGCLPRRVRVSLVGKGTQRAMAQNRRP